jgi:hypothetical protein
MEGTVIEILDGNTSDTLRLARVTAEWVGCNKKYPSSPPPELEPGEHMLDSIQFPTIPQSMQALQVRQYALIPPIFFLCLLEQSPEFVKAGIKISAADGVLFKKLSGRLSDITAAIEAFGAKKKRGAGSGEGKGREEEEEEDVLLRRSL